MVSVREDIDLEENKVEDFFEYTIIELLQGYWRYVYRTKNDPKFKNFWLVINFTKSLFGAALEKK